MDLTGSYLLPAMPGTVWNAIQDPAVLKACLPGCESLEKLSDTEFEARARIKFGPLKFGITGRIMLEEMDPPHRCLMKGEGQGGVAGFARGEAEVLLTPQGSETLLTYTARATMGGKLARLGQRLVDGAARRIADDFFARFAQAIHPPPIYSEAIDPEAAVAALPAAVTAESIGLVDTPPAPPTAADHHAHHRPLWREIWVIELVAVIVVLLILFGLVL